MTESCVGAGDTPPDAASGAAWAAAGGHVPGARAAAGASGGGPGVESASGADELAANSAGTGIPALAGPMNPGVPIPAEPTDRDIPVRASPAPGGIPVSVVDAVASPGGGPAAVVAEGRPSGRSGLGAVGVAATRGGAGGRRTGRRAVWLSVVGLAAVAAVAVPVVAHLAHGRPATMRTPAHLAGFTLDTSSAAVETADYLRNAAAAGLSLDSSVGAVYTDGRGDAHSVIFVGGMSQTGSASARLDAAFGLFKDSADHLSPLTVETPGALGGQMRCGLSTDTSRADRNEAGGIMTVCGWADDSTVGIALFPERTEVQAAQLLRQMRPGLQGDA
jgi:hypothetical protein